MLCNIECLQKRRWIVLTCLLLCVIVGISIYLVYSEFKPGETTPLLKTYKFLFHEVSELPDMETKLIINTEFKPAPKTEKATNDTCKLTCPAQNGSHSVPGDNKIVENYPISDATGNPRFSPLRQDPGIQWIHHGCCSSHQVFASPTKMTNIDGQLVTIVQFKGKRQLFQKDNCTHASGCNRGCRCSMQTVHVVALVVDYTGRDEYFDEDDDLDDARLEFVSYPGSCKCLNN